MSIKKHGDYKSEVKRLEETKTYLENTIGTVVEKRIRFKEEVKDAYIHLDFLDSSLSYVTIMMNSKLLDDLEKNFEQLLATRKKPYFARMDIRQNHKADVEPVYIGKVSLHDTSMKTPMVVDWRTPIASVYYDGRLGEASYQVDDVDCTIDLLNKRQYTIEDGQLVDFMDVDISTTDTFLQASLESHAGEKLKDIVSTIQAEQNRIIRSDIDQPLIVQGVAGSGKTTIALHRIAYLIYTYRETFTPMDFMIIAPNHLFLDYVSSVLPELGADKIKQTTYIDLMFELLGKKLKLTDSNQKLGSLIQKNDGSDREKTLIAGAAAFKNAMAMKDVLDAFIVRLEDQILPEDDYYLEDILLLTRDAIKKMYQETYSDQPLFKRADSVKKQIAAFTRAHSKAILKKVEEDYTKKIQGIIYHEEETEERRQKLTALIEQRQNRLALIKKSAQTAAKKYGAKFYANDLFSLYHELIENLATIADSTETKENQEIFAYIAKESANNQKLYELEDLAPLLYLKCELFGVVSDHTVKVAVIDEAQDFSNFQFYMLHKLLKTERFTILGDLSQGIHMYRAIEDWDFLKNHIFKNETSYLTLEQSYRTTIEIMDAANAVISNLAVEDLVKARPVVRHGEKPMIREFAQKNDVIRTLVETIKNWQAEALTTMAVVTKTGQEAKAVYQALHKENKDLNMALVDEKTEQFNHRILVIPAHLAKDLEFDGVMVVAIDEKYTMTPLDVKLMYVAMTRAMHRLMVVGLENQIPYIIS